MSQMDRPAPVALPADLATENALLRAALADAQRRIAELERRTDTDSLTGLASPRRFREELERVVAQAERHRTPAAIISIDLRGFTAFNERHGQVGGDAALVHVARLLSSLIRSTDVLARTGGDEFALILDHLDHNSAIDTAERLARCIAATPVEIGGKLVRLDPAAAATGILPGDKPEEVTTRAAQNLARAKEA